MSVYDCTNGEGICTQRSLQNGELLVVIKCQRHLGTKITETLLAIHIPKAFLPKIMMELDNEGWPLVVIEFGKGVNLARMQIASTKQIYPL